MGATSQRMAGSSDDQSPTESFDESLLDTVLMTIGIDRLQKAIDRVTGLKVRSRAAPDPVEALWVPFRGTMTRLPIAGIILIEADRDYVRLHDSHQSYLMRATVSDVAKNLGDRFLRIHRSSIIARSRMTGVRHLGKGRWIAITDDGREVPIGRTYLSQIRSALRDREGVTIE